MFNTLETTWDTSARRGWSAAASFTIQALALSLLLAIPLIWVQGPPRLQWLQAVTMPLPMVSSAPSPILHDRYTRTSISTPINPMIAPRYIPRTIQVDNGVAEPAPNLGFVNVGPNARSNAPY